MNDSEQLQRRLERLADGELPAEDRRELLRSLDTIPDGWRRCAITFLEAQSLGEQLKGIAAEASPAAKPMVHPRVGPTESSPMAVWLAVAASAVVAFGLGAFAKQGFAPQPTGPGPSAIVGADHDDGARIPPAPPAPEPEPPVFAGDESLTFWVQDDRGQRRSLTAPLVDAAEFDNRFGLEFPSVVSPEARQRLEGRGFRLSTRRRYAPLFVGDGQPLVVPIEDVQISPVKGTSL